MTGSAPGWLLLALVAGCYAPNPAEGIPCASDGSCPRGQTCDTTGVCVREPGTGNEDNPNPDANPDGETDAPSLAKIAHVSDADVAKLIGSTDWAIKDDATLDTSTLTATPALPDGVNLFVANQLAGDQAGGEIVILDVAQLSVKGTLRVVGTRPLVIVASSGAQIRGTIDLGGKAMEPGGGGFAPAMGPGVGGVGEHDDEAGNGGGGGAGHATAGGGGGVGLASDGGAAGGTVGDLAQALLIGGSGGGAALGGAAQRCAIGGAGGGAIQVSSPSITLDGAITSGGGGGRGGVACNGQYGGGGGGGAGGAIYLQTFSLTGGGVIAANGGGGGEGGDQGFGDGQAGADATLTPAAGGNAGTPGGNGGSGGSADAPTKGGPPNILLGGLNGGGGGGAAGRLYLEIPATVTPTIACSPMCARAP